MMSGVQRECVFEHPPWRTWRMLVAVVACSGIVAGLGWAQESYQVLKFEAEDITQPKDAWQKDKYSEDKWNLWSTDKDAEKKWSEGIVLQSPRVMADREKPEDGAPPLHSTVTEIPPGRYTVEIGGVGRPMGISFDGETWKKIDGSSRNLGEFAITDGTFEIWLDDRYAAETNPGSTYYDYLLFAPVLESIMGVINGGFEIVIEDGIPGWRSWVSDGDTGSVTLTDEVKHEGTYSVALSHEGVRRTALASEGRLKVSQFQELRASAWVKCEGSGSLELTVVGLREGKVVRWSLGGERVSGSSDWKLLEAAVRVPRGLDEVHAHFNATGTVRAWVDEVKIEEGWKPRPERAVKPKVQGFAKQRIEEKMGRGIVALPMDGGRIYVGWRLLKSDPEDIVFNVYRMMPNERAVKLNDEPITATTGFVDEQPVVRQGMATALGTWTIPNEYFVRPVIGGREGEPSAVARAAPADEGRSYVSIKLDGEHTFQKVGIADLDGDGKYDYVIKQPNANIDPYREYWKASPDSYKVEAYLSDGTFLWRKDLGWAIEQGIWYSPMVVYDLDGDGRAEVALKTGEGDPRDQDGRVSSGPEWLSILDGMTGEERARVDWPPREDFPSYNYASRNQLCVAYLDGKTPCLIVERGTYNVIEVSAYEYHDGKLRELWRWNDREEAEPYAGQGAHSMHAADVDGDGRDEVFLGSAVLDDNGNGLWSTGMGHPDHHYVGDIDPARPGLEVYYGYETAQAADGCCMFDARTGEWLWGLEEPTKHVHASGMCSDIDPTHPGMECYSGERDFPEKKWLWAANGELIEVVDLGGLSPRTCYWDADLQREMIRAGRIYDYKGGTHESNIEGRLISVADVLGDWREELIMTLPGELRIYTTTIPARDRRVCLMQDAIYRMDVLIQAMGYTQMPMTTNCLSGSEGHVGLRLPSEKLRPGEKQAAEVVLVAPAGEGLKGSVRLSAAADVTVEPAQMAVDVPAGEVKTYPVSVTVAGPSSLLSGREGADLTARYEGAGGPLESTVAVRALDLPLPDLPRTQAEEFADQGGGMVQIREDKVGADGKCFSHWDAEGHWLEWKLSAPEEGKYWIMVRYCATTQVARVVALDGKALVGGPFRFRSTGGFSGEANDWAHEVLRDPDGEPLALQLTAGEHTVRMTNADGNGMNVDYLMSLAAEE